MFNEEDFDKIKENFDRPPDGLIDASDYYQDMKFITELLMDTDYDDMVSRMFAMMNIMNAIYDDEGEISNERLSGIIIALSFHAINLLNSIEQDSRVDYFKFVNDEILEQIKNEASSLPYWESDETNE